MKITQEEVVDNQTTLRIELEEADLNPYLDQGYRRLAPQISLPGFRKGKVPRHIVEGFMGRESLLNEVLDNMVYEVTSKAIEEQDIDAAGIPKIEDLDLDPVSFTAIIALRPEIELSDYQSLRIPYETDEVSDELVSERIDSIRESMGSWETVERPPQMGDLLSLDARGEIDGEVFWSREDGVLYLDEEGSVPVTGFPQAMVGIEPGQETEFTLPIPEDFRDASIAGMEASFNVTVHEVRDRALPELNDEFAQSLPDEYPSLEELRQGVKANMEAEAAARAESEYETKVIQSLIDQATITIPPVMLENEAERTRNTQDQFLERANIRRDDYLRSIGKTEEEVQQEAEEEAEQRIKRTFALNKVSELENIEVTEQEIDERFNEMYAGQRMRRQERRSRRESLDNMLKYEKTVALLVEIAKSEDQSTDGQAESNHEIPQDAQQESEDQSTDGQAESNHEIPQNAQQGDEHDDE